MRKIICGFINGTLLGLGILMAGLGIYKAYAAATVVNLSTAIVDAVLSSSPEYISADSNGNVYISGTGSGNVQKFNAQGQHLLTIGSSGSGDGQFGAPMGIAIDADGNIFVADKNLNRMQKFDSAGNFVTKWGSAGSGDGQFASGGSMGGVAVDSSGNVYVVDSYNDRVQKFDNDGNFITKWGTNGSGNTNFYFYAPSDIAIDQSGNVYIADSGNHRIKKYTQNGAFVSAFGSNGSGEGQFDNPVGLAVDLNGKIYVADYNNSRIQVFDSSYNFVEQWGSYGSGSGQFENTTDVLYGPINNLLYVLDYGVRIQFFDLGSYNPGSSPTPTPAASSATVLTQNNTSNSTSQDTGCYALPPVEAPAIFEAVRVNSGQYDSVKINYTPVNDRTNGYKVMYGSSLEANEYGLSYKEELANGAQAYTINYLSSDKEYYFRMQAANDCATGPWSNTHRVATLIGKSIESDNTDRIINSKSLQAPSEAATTQLIDASVTEENTVGNRPIDRIFETIKSESVMSAYATKVSDVVIELGIINIIVTLGVGGISSIIAILRGLIPLYGQTTRSSLLLPLDVVVAMVQKMTQSLKSIGFSIFGLAVQTKTRAKGVVFDCFTMKPIKGVYVILFSKSGNLRSCFSDHYGKYALTPVPDDYELRAQANDYTFPSTIVQSDAYGQYQKIYMSGKVISVKQPGEVVSEIAIPLDPVGSQSILDRMLRLIRLASSALFLPLIGLLMIASGFATYYQSGAYYLLLFILTVGYFTLRLGLKVVLPFLSK